LTLFLAPEYFMGTKAFFASRGIMARQVQENDIADEELSPESAEKPTGPDEEVSETPLEDLDESEPDIVKELKAEIAELNDKILRMAAENQNTRKRLVKQQQDAHQYRHQDILRDLTEVVDNFERAIESAAESKDFDTFYQGIVMIEKQFSGMLTERYNLERIGVVGEQFNPVTHEAITVVEEPEAETETVKEVFMPGYRLYERILKPAKVVVVKPVAALNADISEETDE